ncbi:MAG TPA: sulfatase [Verrucomicrobiae bacterium]|nr:sulfatase [Verrucomicrobiae bacterium]
MIKKAPFLVAQLLAIACACSGETPATVTGRPNILFAIADDWSHPHAGAYGCKWVRTPGFDRVAREGVLFANAYTPNAKCAPSRACILTGRNSWQLKAACNHVAFFPPEFKTYAEALSGHGYFVGMTCKGWAPGVANDADGKPREMAGRPFNKRTAPPPTSGINKNDYAANFSDFLDAAPKGQPWCFWYGSVEPHRAYEYGTGASIGGKKIGDIERVPGYWPDNEVVRNDMLDYALEVEHFDAHLGRMLADLERRGSLDNTLILVTSDNGMPFPRAKGNEYEVSNHMPLAAMWKRGIRAPGRVVTDYVSFIDFAPTFIDVAGLKWDQTGMAPPAGRSLTDIFASEKAGRVNPARDHVLLGQERHDTGRPHDWGYPIRSILQDGWLYMNNFEPTRWPVGNPEAGYLNTDGGATKTFILDAHRKDPRDKYWAMCFGKRVREELYDLAKDPDCITNLAAQPDQQERKARLKGQLFDELKAQEDPRMFGNGGVFEAEPYANPAHRGFYERYMRGEKIKAGWVNDTDFEKAPLD